MRASVIATCLMAVCVLTAATAHGARCSGIASPVFCDDFDRYCDPPPADPQAGCDSSYAPAEALTDPFYQNWAYLPLRKCKSGVVSAVDELEGPGSWKDPVGYMVKIWEYDGGSPQGIWLYRHENDMTAEILAHPDNVAQYPRINGAGEISVPLETDGEIKAGYIDSMDRSLRPDALKGQFFMNFAAGAQSRAVSYVELFLDNDRAPLDYSMQFCPPDNTGPGSLGYNNPRLNRNGDGQPHASFAVGVVATFDDNVCNLDTGWYPTQWRLVAFDGLQWKEFRAGTWGIYEKETDVAGFYPKGGWNKIYFSIGADYIEVRLRNFENNPDPSAGGSENRYAAGKIPNPWWVARIPRQYKGGFNKIAIGPNYGLDTTTPTCENFGSLGVPNMKCNGGVNDGKACGTSADCPAATSTCSPRINGANQLYIDEVVLYDGAFQSAPAACCHGDGTCEILDADACSTAGGVFHTGVTSCEPSPCCPIPFADFDRDHDVDMKDFAALQRCLTIPAGVAIQGEGCACFDSDGNGTIDADDVVGFGDCATGEGVTWVSTPACP